MQIKRCLKIFGVGMVKNGCGQSGDRTQKLAVPEEQTDGVTEFLHFDTDSQNLKADQNFFGWTWSKMSVIIDLSKKWTDGINCFLHVGTNPGKLKVDSMICG